MTTTTDARRWRALAHHEGAPAATAQAARATYREGRYLTTVEILADLSTATREAYRLRDTATGCVFHCDQDRDPEPRRRVFTLTREG